MARTGHTLPRTCGNPTPYQRAPSPAAARYKELRDAEEAYLRQRQVSADLEAQARRLREREEGRAQEDELLQAARREQVRQLEALSRERRERARAVEERARLARLEQVRLMAAQEEAHRDRARAKQREALAEMDAQLEARAREDEQWLQGQLEAERLQQVEFETALRLQHAAQAHAEEGQAALLQSEVDARRRLLDVKQQTAAQRWAAEDAQKRTGRALEELEQRREAEAEEEHGAIVAAQARAPLPPPPPSY